MSMSDRPVVRVVIPCRNEQAYIERCLRSLVDADRSDMLVDVHVCDGLSDDGTRDIIDRITREQPWIRLVDNPQRTTPFALNLGLRGGAYDVGIILGAHAEVAKDFLRANIDALQQHPEAGCVGGIIESVYTSDEARVIGAAMTHPFGVGSAHFRTGLKEGPVDTVAFGAYRREVFERIGYFDERLVRNQDDEFNYRVTKAGFGIFLSRSIRSRYFVRGSFEKLFAQYDQYGYWKVYVNRIHRTVTTWRQLVPALFVAFLVVGMVLAFFSPWIKWIWVLGMLAYVLALLVASFRVAGPNVPVVSVMRAFVTLHMAYGIGYLRGLWEFVVLGKGPNERANDLTR
jgi:GT2 family glycosyltransferase